MGHFHVEGPGFAPSPLTAPRGSPTHVVPPESVGLRATSPTAVLNLGGVTLLRRSQLSAAGPARLPGVRAVLEARDGAGDAAARPAGARRGRALTPCMATTSIGSPRRSWTTGGILVTMDDRQGADMVALVAHPSPSRSTTTTTQCSGPPVGLPRRVSTSPAPRRGPDRGAGGDGHIAHR